MNVYGLIGYPLGHSFSPTYFAQKFAELGIADTHNYRLFPLASIREFPALIQAFRFALTNTGEQLCGLNVTIPYKQLVIPYLDDLSPQASDIGAVNTIQFKGTAQTLQLIGHNTDAYGFEHSLRPLLAQVQFNYTKGALILGTGGASKAVAYVLEKLGIAYTFVSRNPKSEKQFSYKQLKKDHLDAYHLIINTTPLGTYPDVDRFPAIPYAELSKQHICYDLVYNPAETAFLQKAKAQGATIANGAAMLKLQAERAWEIWNDKNSLS